MEDLLVFYDFSNIYDIEKFLDQAKSNESERLRALLQESKGVGNQGIFNVNSSKNFLYQELYQSLVVIFENSKTDVMKSKKSDCSIEGLLKNMAQIEKGNLTLKPKLIRVQRVLQKLNIDTRLSSYTDVIQLEDRIK